MLDIQQISNNSMKEADRLLKAAQALVDSVKEVIVKGTDTLTQGQVEEWLLAIPVMVSELLPIKEAYELTRKLYTIDLDVEQAKGMLDATDRGARRDAQLTLKGQEWEVNKAVMYYVRDRAGDMVNSLQSLLMSLMKIHTSKMSAPKEG